MATEGWSCARVWYACMRVCVCVCVCVDRCGLLYLYRMTSEFRTAFLLRSFFE